MVPSPFTSNSLNALQAAVSARCNFAARAFSSSLVSDRATELCLSIIVLAKSDGRSLFWVAFAPELCEFQCMTCGISRQDDFFQR